MAKQKECECKNKNDFVGIGAALGGILIPIVLFFLLFAPQQAWVLAIIAGCFTVMAIVLGYLAYKKK